MMTVNDDAAAATSFQTPAVKILMTRGPHCEPAAGEWLSDRESIIALLVIVKVGAVI